jgi:tyrosyl-tRNA synthetase
LGLDPTKTEFVYGTDYQLEPDYVINVLKMARSTTLRRARRSMDEVGRNMDNPHVSQMVYPLMQAVDIASLNLDVAVGGIDQRKIHMLAREEMPKLGLKAPICVHTPIISGLNGGKMSSSKANYISVDDSAEELEKKIKSAYCPAKEVESNPITELFKYHIMPRVDEVVIQRPEKFGGDVAYGKYDALEEDFVSGAMHPMDLKKGAIEYLNLILEPVRGKMG